MGNEQDNKYSADDEAADFAVLRDLLLEQYPDASTRPKILGPDVHGFHTGADEKRLNFLHEFVEECQELDVPLHAVTHHEYVEVNEYSKMPPPASRLDLT